MPELPSLVLSAFACLMAVPFCFGVWRLGATCFKALVLAARRGWQARRPVRATPLSPEPLPLELSLHMRRFAHTTRGLVASLEHASQRSAGWRDDVPKSWLARLITVGRDTDFQPTIGVTGEVWGWLQSAEAIADSEDRHADVARRVAMAVRSALLRTGPLGPRLREMLGHLVGADAELRACGSSPYRGPLRAPAKPVLRQDADPEPQRQADCWDREDYARALDEHATAIVGVARKYTNDEASTEDLVQDIKLSVWRAFDRFRGDASVRTYILRIAHYRAVSFLRRQRSVVPEREEADPGPDADTRIDDARKRFAVAQAIEGLPESQRDAIGLLLEGLSYRDIGERLGITEKATSVRITRARRALRLKFSGS